MYPTLGKNSNTYCNRDKNNKLKKEQFKGQEIKRKSSISTDMDGLNFVQIISAA